MEGPTEGPSRGLDLPWTETGSLARMILVLAFVGAVAGVAIGLSWRSTAGAQRPRSLNLVAVTETACAPSWTAPRSGLRTFTVPNDTHKVVAVQLMGAKRVPVDGDSEVLAPGTSRLLTVVLPPGTFSWRCHAGNGSVRYSKTTKVSHRAG
jgi:high-affinity iron transporter